MLQYFERAKITPPKISKICTYKSYQKKKKFTLEGQDSRAWRCRDFKNFAETHQTVPDDEDEV